MSMTNNMEVDETLRKDVLDVKAVRGCLKAQLIMLY